MNSIFIDYYFTMSTILQQSNYGNEKNCPICFFSPFYAFKAILLKNSENFYIKG